jgi:hypothetical protein
MTPMKKPRSAGLFHGRSINAQKNEAIRTERTLIQDQTIMPTTTTMGKP